MKVSKLFLALWLGQITAFIAVSIGLLDMPAWLNIILVILTMFGAIIGMFFIDKKNEGINWIRVEDRLPETIIYEDGSCNVVLAKHKAETTPVCGSEYQTCAVPYLVKYPEQYTHWAEITPPTTKYSKSITYEPDEREDESG